MTIPVNKLGHYQPQKEENTPTAFEQTITQKQGQVFHNTDYDTSLHLPIHDFTKC